MNFNARLGNTLAQFNANIILSRKGNRVKNVAVKFQGDMDSMQYSVLQQLASVLQAEFTGRRTSEAIVMLANLQPTQAMKAVHNNRTFDCFSWDGQNIAENLELRLAVQALAQTNS